MKITLSKSQWQNIGKQAGWTKVSQSDDNVVEPRQSFSYGMTPEDLITKKVVEQTPSGYPMLIKSQEDWTSIANAVNQGIDAHLEGFTRSTFDNKTGKCIIHPDEMKTFLRRLYDSQEENAESLRSSILETLGLEEI
jgi:hypothetical protein